MYCRNCGKQLQENAVVCLNCGVQAGTGNKYCPTCGKQVDDLAVVCVQCGTPLKEMKKEKKLHPIIERVKVNAIDKFFDFSGRMPLKEFWWWYLSACVLAVVLGCIPVIGWIAVFALEIPIIASMARRLHDVGRPTLHLLFFLIPIAGTVLFILWCIQPSVIGPNEYGPQPME